MPHPVASVDKMLRRCRAALGMHLQRDSHYPIENSSFFYGRFPPLCNGLSLAVHMSTGVSPWFLFGPVRRARESYRGFAKKVIAGTIERFRRRGHEGTAWMMCVDRIRRGRHEVRIVKTTPTRMVRQNHRVNLSLCVVIQRIIRKGVVR